MHEGLEEEDEAEAGLEADASEESDTNAEIEASGVDALQVTSAIQGWQENASARKPNSYFVCCDLIVGLEK